MRKEVAICLNQGFTRADDYNKRFYMSPHIWAVDAHEKDLVNICTLQTVEYLHF